MKNKKLIQQILKFGVVGGLAFLIDYGILFVCTEYLHIYYLTSSIISFTVSVIFNYFASVKFVFTVKENSSKKKNFIIFIVLSVIGLGINQLIMWLGTDILDVYYMITKIGATIIVMIYNFISKKLTLEERSIN